MSAFVNQFKSEVARLSKKQVRAETSQLKLLCVRYRKELSQLRRRVAVLESLVKINKRSVGSTGTTAEISDPQATPRQFRPKAFASFRRKLKLSARDMGRLLDVSAQSVYHWESGKSRPRARQIAAIAELRQAGRREIAERFAG